MTVTNKKDRIIAVVAYIICAIILSYQKVHWFSIVYFAAVALVIIFADKLFGTDCFLSKTFAAAFCASIAHNTLFEIFYSVHGNMPQILSAVGVAVFLSGIFAMTERKNLPLSILAAPALCFLNFRIALCYSVLLLIFSVIKIHEEKFKKTKSQKGKKKKIKFYPIAVVISLISIGACTFLTAQPENQNQEMLQYYLSNFKNNIWVIIATIYFLIKLLKSSFKSKLPMLLGMAVVLVTAVTGLIFLGWAVFSLACLCALAFLILCSLQNRELIDAIKYDYENNKYLFWVLIICLLQ